MRALSAPRPDVVHDGYVVFLNSRNVRSGGALDLIYVYAVVAVGPEPAAQPVRLQRPSRRWWEQQAEETGEDHDDTHDAQVQAEQETRCHGEPQDRPAAIRKIAVRELITGRPVSVFTGAARRAARQRGELLPGR